METEQLLSIPENDYISSYTVAHATVDEAVLSHKEYHDLIKKCMDHIAGEKPIHPDKLKKAAMAWASNWNYGKARAKIEKGVAENVSKIMSAVTLAVPKFRGKKKSDLDDPIYAFLHSEDTKIFVSDAIMSAFVETIQDEDRRFTSFVQKTESCSYPYGFAPVVYDKYDWLGRVVHNSNICFEPETDPDDIKLWVELEEISAKDLWRKWVDARNEQIKQEIDPDRKILKRAKSGWVINGLQAVLERAFKGKTEEGGIAPTWEKILPIYEKSPQTAIQSTESVSVAKISYKELDGTFKKVTIPYGNTWQTNGSVNNDKQKSDASGVDMIIYKKEFGQFVQDDHINIIRDNLFTERGTIQELRGISKFAVEDSVRYNRTRNQLGNKMNFTGSPMFEQPNTQTGEKFKMAVSQGFVLLPPGYRPIEKQPSFDIGSQISVLKFEEGEYLRDTVHYDPKLEGRLSSRPTKDEVKQTTQEIQKASLSKDSVKIRDYAHVFLNMMRKMASLKGLKKSDKGYSGAMRFRELIKEYITFVETDADVKKLIDAVCSLQIEVINGDMGSLQLGASISETSFGRQRFKRMMLIASGFSYADARIAIPFQSDKAAGLVEERIVGFENNSFWNTNDVAVLDSDDDITHLIGHIAKVMRVIEGVKTGALEPIKGYQFVSNCLPHTMQHMSMMEQQGMKGPQFDEIKSMLQKINQELPSIKQAAQQQAQTEQQEKAQRVMSTKEVEQLKIKSMETEAKMQRGQQQSDFRAEQRLKDQEFNQALKAQQQDFTQKLEAQKVFFEQQLEVIKNGQKPNV